MIDISFVSNPEVKNVKYFNDMQVLSEIAMS